MSKKRAAKDKSKKKSDKHKHHKKDHSTRKHKEREFETASARAASEPASRTRCAEHGVWTDVTRVKHPPADHQPLQFSSVDPDENERILSSGKMSFAMVGCSGDAINGTNTQAVGAALSADKDLSFLYHLGDMIYTISGSDTEGGKPVKRYSRSLWDNQLFGPYAKFPKKIFAIAGNHDGKYKQKIKALRDYFRFFCADTMKLPTGSKRKRKMKQPYIYWSLDTPYAYIVGLYSNIANGGILDKPSDYTGVHFKRGPQYKWLVKQLQAVGKTNKKAGAQKKAVLLTVHYPPYSGAANFNVRGDQSKGGPAAKRNRPAQPNNYDAPYLAVALQQAFKDSGQRPDAIFSAHAHLYQRLNYRFADKTTMPCLVVGCGGHSPLEELFQPCDGTLESEPRMPPFPPVKPGMFEFPEGDSAEVEAFDDKNFGYLKVTVDAKAHTLTSKLIAVKAVEIDSQTMSIG
jgi:hypothetical protein